MERSIENIWSKGFLNSNELKAPKINNLYNRKSALVIEKIKKSYKLDMKLGIIIIALSVIAFSYFALYITAIYTAIVFTLLFLYNESIMKSLNAINITTNSFDYLTTYRNKLHESIRKTYFLMGVFFPLVLLLGYYVSYNESGIYEKVMMKFGTLSNSIILLSSYLILSVIMLLAYFLSLKLLYGSSLKKLDDIITDVEELRS